MGERKFKFKGPQPRPILLRINKKLGGYVPHPMIEHFKFVKARTLATPDMRDWLAKHGADPMSMTQSEFAHFVLSESERAARIIRAAGIKPQEGP